MATAPAWSPADLETLEREWSNGKSAAEIGKLVKRTRNAVCGMVHRRGLPPRLQVGKAATYRPPKFTRTARALPKPPKVKKSLVLSWKSGPPPRPKPAVKVDPNSPASLAAAALLGVAAATERRNEQYRARGVNLSW